MKFSSIGCFCLFVFSSIHMMAQDSSMFQKLVFEKNDDRLPYRILQPKDFDASKTYPLLLFLHGSGERGDDNEAQLTHGAKLFLNEKTREKYPAIVVFPQCRANSSWAKLDVVGEWGNREFIFYKKAAPTIDMELLEGLVSQLKTTYNIDEKRMYVGGLSMGGMGTFELVRRNPKMFAAAFPICGGANPKIAKKIKKVNWWIFHGDADEAVPPQYSTQMVDALKKVGADVKYSLYPDVGHNSWDNTFAEPELLSWLFSNSK